MNRELTADLCRTRDGRPLVTLDGLPGGGADLTPADLRTLADVLLRIAADAQARPARGLAKVRKTYSLAATP